MDGGNALATGGNFYELRSGATPTGRRRASGSRRRTPRTRRSADICWSLRRRPWATSARRAPRFLEWSELSSHPGSTDRDRRADLDRQRLPELQLPDRLPRNRRGARDRPAGPREVPGGRQGQGLADHADPEYPRAPRPHRRQRGGGRGDRREGDRAPQRGRQDPRASTAGVGAGDVIKVGKTVELECMDTPGHTMCHICLRSHTDQPALFSRRHAVQRRRRQLPQRRSPGRALQDVRRPARQAARRTRWSIPATTTSRTTCSSRSTASRTTLQRRAMLPRVDGQDPADLGGVDAARRRSDQHVLPPVEPERDRAGCARAFRTCPSNPIARTVFIKLRELRNSW